MERVLLLPGRERVKQTLSRTLRRTDARAQRAVRQDTPDAVTVVLGGGRGNRLLPLTLKRCKPAMPVGGTYRLVDVSISNSLESGIGRVFVLTQYNSASLNAHLARTFPQVEVLAAEQTFDSSEWYLGTADAVRKQLQRIRESGAREVVVLAGDHLYRMDLRAFLARHREARADVTVGVTRVPRATASQFGLLRADDDDMIVEFVEKPRDPVVIDRFRRGEDCLASMGIYVFRLDALARMLEDPRAIDFGMHVIPRAIAERPVAAFRFDGYWEDLGTVASYHRANVLLAGSRLGQELLAPGKRFHARPRALPPARIDGARIRSSIVSDGCILEEGVEVSGSVLGPETTVKRGARLEETVVFGGAASAIGEGAVVRRAIVDEDARVGDGAVLENRAGLASYDGEQLSVRDGIIVVHQGAAIPAGFVF